MHILVHHSDIYKLLTHPLLGGASCSMINSNPSEQNQFLADICGLEFKAVVASALEPWLKSSASSLEQSAQPES